MASQDSITVFGEEIARDDDYQVEPHPFAGISRPSIDALLDRNAKWFEQGCAAGETDSALAYFGMVQASLLQAQALQRIAARLERKNWLVRLWQFLIWEPEVR